jgi:hypothetical protein
MPRQKTEINVEQVKKLAALHCTNVEIAAFFDVDEKTIRNRFSDIIAKGKENGKIRLRRMQFRLAEKSPAMAIWLGKQLLGQVETNVPQNEELRDRELVLYEEKEGDREKMMRYLS